MGSKTSRQEINMVKRVNKFSHASSEEMQELFKNAQLNKSALGWACENLHDACDICGSTGRPKDRKKVSLTHVDESFNAEIQGG